MEDYRKNFVLHDLAEQRGGKIVFSDVSAEKRKKTETRGTSEEENASFLSDADKQEEHRGEKGISNVVITEKKTKKRRNVEEVEVLDNDDEVKATSVFSSAGKFFCSLVYLKMIIML